MTDVIPTVSAPEPKVKVKTKTKRTSKAARVRAQLAKGKTPVEIAKALRVLPQYVYTVRAYDKKKAEKQGTGIKRKVGRPRKAQVHYVDVLLPQPQKPLPVFGRPPTLWERVKALFN